jgi:hypothetical protein
MGACEYTQHFAIWYWIQVLSRDLPVSFLKMEIQAGLSIRVSVIRARMVW